MGLGPILRAVRGNPNLTIGLVMVLVCLTAAAPELFTSFDPIKTKAADALQAPNLTHLFGTDHLGRDLFARTLYGARVTIFYALVTLAISAAIASTIGGVAAYYGGRVDTLLSALINGMFAFPDVLIAILIVATLGPNLLNAVIAAGIGVMPAFARMARGLVLGNKHLEYVAAARVVGASDPRILLRHITPNCAGTMLAFVVLRFSTLVLTVATLGFLGLGAPPPNPELGVLVADGRTYFRSNPHISVIPGLALGFVVLGFNLLGDGLSDMLGSRQR